MVDTGRVTGGGCRPRMRQARIKVPSDEGLGVYHAMTRTVNRERLFGDGDQEILRRQIWQVAEYTGVEGASQRDRLLAVDLI